MRWVRAIPGCDGAPAWLARSWRAAPAVALAGALTASVPVSAQDQGAVIVAQQIGISHYAIGVTIVAIGTTLPDKAISIVAGRRGESGVVLANASGSNIFVLTLALGLAALLSDSGLAADRLVTRIDVPLLIAASSLTILLFHRPTLGRGTGITLLSLYIVYFTYALMRGE